MDFMGKLLFYKIMDTDRRRRDEEGLLSSAG
jgi:hypothetical protein